MSNSDFYPSANTSFINNSDFYPSANTSFISSHTQYEHIPREDDLQGRANEDEQETRLVIGLDYGATYTGMLSQPVLLVAALTPC